MFKFLKKKEQTVVCYHEHDDYIYVKVKMLSGADKVCFCIKEYYNYLKSENMIDDNTLYNVYDDRHSMIVAHSAFSKNL